MTNAVETVDPTPTNHGSTARRVMDGDPGSREMCQRCEGPALWSPNADAIRACWAHRRGEGCRPTLRPSGTARQSIDPPQVGGTELSEIQSALCVGSIRETEPLASSVLTRRRLKSVQVRGRRRPRFICGAPSHDQHRDTPKQPVPPWRCERDQGVVSPCLTATRSAATTPAVRVASPPTSRRTESSVSNSGG